MDFKNKKIWGIIALAVAAVAAVAVTVAVVMTNDDDLTIEARVSRILADSPVIDGHNDLPWNLRNLAYNDLSRVDLKSDLKQDPVWGKERSSHTDIPRLRQGNVGGQFWVAYTSCSSQYKDSVEQTLEQIDVIKRMAKMYSEDLQFAASADDIEDAISNGKIASLIGVEGGHSMQFSLGILRQLYELGARYMTMTHSCNTPWADSSPVDAPNPTIQPESNGLSEFGLEIVTEMNRLGMMVDLSHVSAETMRKALGHSKAPVIFSHSSSRTVCDHHRNVPDDVLELVKQTNSLVMVNFYSAFVNCNASRRATLNDVVQHINYIKNITGPDHVGLGADYDGVDDQPDGLEDVSKYPDLLAALLQTGEWSDDDLRKLTGQNLIRVFREVEKVRDDMARESAGQNSLKQEDLDRYKVNTTCITAKFENTKDGRVRRSFAEEREML